MATLLLRVDALAQTSDGSNLSRQQYDQQYTQAIDGELYQEAADLTKSYLNDLLKSPDPDAQEWGQALGRLGYAQHHAGNFSAAIENYQLAVEVLEADENRLHSSLADPLLGLSRAQTAAGQFRDAVVTYNRVLHVQQVNNGPHTMAQAEAVNELSNVFYYLGNTERANALQQAYVSIYQQNYPDDYIAQLPAQLSRARMLKQTGQMFDSQNAYRRVISGIEGADSSKSLYLLPTIYELADVYQQNRVVDGADGSKKARRFLRRAIHIAEENEDATPLDLADAHIAYGDYLMVQTVDRRAALRQYMKAWDLLSADPELSDAVTERFAEPLLLNAIPSQSTAAMRKLMLLAEHDPDEAAARLAVRYDIGPDGRPREVQIVEGDPTGYWDSIVVNHVDNFVFRPGIVDGEATEFNNHLYEIRFSPEDQDLPADLRQNELNKQVSVQQ